MPAQTADSAGFAFMVVSRFLVVLASVSVVGCAHSQPSAFDQLLSVVDRRDHCIERLEVDAKSPSDTQAMSVQSIIGVLVESMSGELRAELARVADAASRSGRTGAELGADLRRHLSEVDLFRIKHCGAVATEALPNILVRRLSDRDGQFLSAELGMSDTRDVEGFVFAAVALESAKIKWDVLEFK